MLNRDHVRELPPDAAHDDAWYQLWRTRELSRLDAYEMCYVDYTGAALAPDSLLRADSLRLRSTVLGNPHSAHAASEAATNNLEEARHAILDWLHASPDEYGVIFTANASAACRLVGEAFPFERDSVYCLAADNHNSVNGIGQFARARGADIRVLPLNDELRLQQAHFDAPRAMAPSLFAFPAQSNFSGVRHPLSLVRDAQAHGYRVLLDAASFLPTGTLRLDETHPDFVVLSLYKIIGYPWGVGALVVRHEALAQLTRPWFSGGTVDWVSIAHSRHQMRRGTDAFEDGTPAFLAAGAVPLALQAYRTAEPDRLARHTSALTEQLLLTLKHLTHDNGSPVAVVYGPRSMHQRGATVTLNVHDRDGAVVPHWVVEQDAKRANIAMRGGCFCNPGCAEHSFKFSLATTRHCLEQLGPEFSVPAFAACLGGSAVGAVRISFGLGSVHNDVHRVTSFLTQYTNVLHIEPAMPAA
jgi:selenocysteine lyase/cysteine desulfurase